jgi:putative addiction module antidote
MTTVRVADMGDSLVVVFSKETMEQFGMRAGDELQVIAAKDGMNLRRHDAVVQRQLEVADRVMEKRHDVLRRLAE